MSIKTGATILIITAGVVGGYLIVKTSPVSVENDKKSENSAEKITLDKNPLKWVENFVSGKNNNSDKAGEINGIIIPDNADSLNLTEFVAKSTFSGMQRLDQSGQNPFNNNQQLIQKVIAGIQNPESFLKTSVDDKDIKISNNNSKENINRYIGAAAEVISENSNNIYRNPTDVIEKAIYGNISNIQELADIYHRLFTGYLNLEVPSDLFDLHKRYLIIFKKSEILYRGIANFQKDPVKAALFIDMAPEIIQEEISIKKEYYDKAVQYGT